MQRIAIPIHKCTCGYEMDSTIDPKENSYPKEGDISVCFHCGKVSIFNDDLTQHEITPFELKHLDDSELESIAAVQSQIRKINN